MFNEKHFLTLLHFLDLARKTQSTIQNTALIIIKETHEFLQVSRDSHQGVFLYFSFN